MPTLHRGEVIDLLGDYCWAVDSSDGAAFAATFTPTGGMYTPRFVAVGHEELRRFAVETNLADVGVQHWNANIRYRQLTPTTGEVDCYMFALKIRADPPQIELSGFYHDEIEFLDGRWRFAARHLRRPGFQSDA